MAGAFLLFLLLSSVLLTLSIHPVHADSKSTQKKLKATNAQIDSLKEQQAALDEKLDGYSNDLASVSAQVALLNDKIELKEEEIALIKENIALEEEHIAEQYEDMKLRIRFMYENRKSNSYLTLFLEAGSLGEFLNEAQYISSIEEYDQQMLEDYKNTLEDLQKQKSSLDEELSALEETQAETSAKEEELSNMVANAEYELAKTEEELADQIAAAKAYEEQLEREKLAEEKARAAARAAALAAQKSYANTYVSGAGDLEMLAAIIYCEAGGESYAGQLAVGSVILNRVNSGEFPASISGVIYQSGQFSPVASGRFALALQNGLYSNCLSAAKEVLGGHITNNYLYFHSTAGWDSDYGEVIGNQVFY